MKPLKIKIFILPFLVNTCLFSFAQTPQKVSYQSVIRDATGELIRSRTVGMLISILQGSASGTPVYMETHTPEANLNGLVSVEVGNGTLLSETLFTDIDWSAGPYFLRVETDPAGETNYSITGTTEILSVPYALYSKKAETVETETQTLAHVAALGNSVNTQLKNVSDPTDDQDASTKAYVDALEAKIEKLENSFKAGGILYDERDGNYYNTIRIGEQVWMAENLAYLPSVSLPADGSEDGVGTESYYYVYDYSGSDVSAAKATANYTTYGVLYNWPAATTACPSADGWHLPTDAEWTQMENYLAENGYNYDGTTGGGRDKIAKSLASTSGWTSSSNVGSVGNIDYSTYRNKSGFTALPGGFRNYRGPFYYIGYDGIWWTATESGATCAWGRGMNYYYSYVVKLFNEKEVGFSVRCIKD